MARDKNATYYDEGGIETLDIIKAKLTKDGYRGYLLGNLVKYVCRANYKGAFYRDIEKVKIYASELLKDGGKDNGSA